MNLEKPFFSVSRLSLDICFFFQSQLHQTVINMHEVFFGWWKSKLQNLQKESQQIPWNNQNDCFTRDLFFFATNSWKEHHQ